MNRVIEVHGGRRLIIPVGLPELMNDIGKEVIKHQPENLLEFIAEYLEKRVDELRRRDPLRKDYSEIERTLSSETRIILDECGIDLFTAIKAATTIQATFRGFQVRQRLEQNKYDGDKSESDQYVTPTDTALPSSNGETLAVKLDESLTSFSMKATEEKSSSTIGSAFFSIPEVDFKAPKPSFDQVSNYEQVSLIDYEDYGPSVTDRSSFTQSMISTNTITRDMAMESNTYLDLTLIAQKSLDPFKELSTSKAEATNITSDLEIFKHIDLEQYEDTNKTYEKYMTNFEHKGTEGKYSTDEASISSHISGSTQKNKDNGDVFEGRFSSDEKSKSPRASGSTQKSKDHFDDMEGRYHLSSLDEKLTSPRISGSSQKSKDNVHDDRFIENTGDKDSHDKINSNLAEIENEENAL